MDLMIPPEVLVCVVAITSVVESMKKFIPSISDNPWVQRIMSIFLGVCVGFTFISGPGETQLMGGLVLGLASSGLYDNAKQIGRLKNVPPAS